MSRPRVLYILGSLAANDVGDEIVAILEKLPRSRFEPCVVNLGGREELRERVDEVSAETHTLGLVGPIGAYRAVAKARSLIRSLDAKVVHGYGSWGGSVAQLAAPPDVAVVRTVTRAPTYEHDLRGRVLRYLEGRARSRVHTRFVVPSTSSVGLALRAYGAVEGHVSVLPTSVDVDRVRSRVEKVSRAEARVRMDLDPDDTVFVLVTGFESEAFLDQVLTGFTIAAQERPGMRMCVVGSGRHEGAVRWKADELGLAREVGFLGRVSVAGPVWAAADVVIDGTSQSSWSRPALTAIAAGLPTVKVQDGITGWSEDLDEALPMVSAQPERFAVDLIRLASDRMLREEIAERDADFARDIDVAVVASQLGALYQSLLN
jgi:hypothetical protein